MKKFWQNNKPVLKFIALVFVVWAAAVNFFDWVSPWTGVPHREGFNYVELKIFNPPFFWNRASFDGMHYLDIARKGYDIHQQAFFPFYPKLIKWLTPTFAGRDLMAGMIVSYFSFFFSLFLLYKLVRLDYKDEVARRTVIFLVIFPTSFFFGLVYTESLFLFLLLASFYSVRKERWLLAGIFGALAANTRLVGVFIFPALLYEWWLMEKREVRSGKLDKAIKIIPLLLIPLGLLSYMRFLWLKHNDPLMFIHSQPFFGAGRSGGRIILLYQVFWRYLKMIFTTKADPLYFTVWLEFLVAIGFIFLLIKAYTRKVRISYLIFSGLSFIAPTISGTFSSLPRYVLILFPCLIYLGAMKNNLLRRSLIVVFVVLGIVCATLFFRGYWIA